MSLEWPAEVERTGVSRCDCVSGVADYSIMNGPIAIQDSEYLCVAVTK